MKKLDIKLYRMEVVKGKESVAREWLDFLKSNKEDVAQTLKNEKVYLESYFVAEEGGVMFIYCFMAADDIGKAVQIARASGNELDKRHFEYAAECISQTSGDIMDCFLLLENLDSAASPGAFY